MLGTIHRGPVKRQAGKQEHLTNLLSQPVIAISLHSMPRDGAGKKAIEHEALRRISRSLTLGPKRWYLFYQ